MEFISNLASIITVILFIGAIIGKIFVIMHERKSECEKVDLMITNNEKAFSKYKIIDECILDEKCTEYVLITPTSKYYNWLKIYRYNFEKDSIGECVFKTDKIYYNQSVKINAWVTCGMPNYIVVFERDDYMRCSMPISHNGKNGIQEKLINCKLTFKSILYYLFK